MATISRVEVFYRIHLSLLALATIVSFYLDEMRRSEQPLGLRGSRCGLSHGPVTVLAVLVQRQILEAKSSGEFS